MRIFHVLVAAILVLSGSPALAGEERDGEEAALGASAVAVLQHCHDVSLSEQAAAQLAIDQGGRRIQRRARQLLKAYAAADKRVRAVARRHGATLVDHAAPPPQLDDDAFVAERIEVRQRLLAYLTGAINSAVIETDVRTVLEDVRARLTPKKER